MFMSDFSKKAGIRSDEFSRYCKNEGLDRVYILSRLKEDKKIERKIRKYTGYPWKLLKKTVMAFR